MWTDFEKFISNVVNTTRLTNFYFPNEKPKFIYNCNEELHSWGFAYSQKGAYLKCYLSLDIQDKVSVD